MVLEQHDINGNDCAQVLGALGVCNDHNDHGNERNSSGKEFIAQQFYNLLGILSLNL